MLKSFRKEYKMAGIQKVVQNAWKRAQANSSINPNGLKQSYNAYRFNKLRTPEITQEALDRGATSISNMPKPRENFTPYSGVDVWGHN